VNHVQDSPLLSRARALAGFVGDGRPLTAKGVLRRDDIAPACAAAGLPDPGRVVSAADVPALHRAWVAAQGAGLIVLDVDRAVAGTPGEEPAAQWLGGVRALLRERIGAAVVCRVALGVLDSASGIDHCWFGRAFGDAVDRLPIAEQVAAYEAFRRGRQPETGALQLLVECGAVDQATLAVTPLGRWALDRLAESPAPAPAPARADGDILQLKIGLDRFRPPVWRRVLVPAGTSLGDLHQIVQIALEWDDDHLHVFTVDGIGYADPDHGLDGCGDEETIALASALPRPGARLAYRYDLGDCWDHTILLEKVLAAEPDARYPSCTGGRGDAPVEDWGLDEPPPARPFRAGEIDSRLAAGVHGR
jgi:Plasmid pRiA4b ORF-3-like protein